jgi:hypothetical protein
MPERYISTLCASYLSVRCYDGLETTACGSRTARTSRLSIDSLERSPESCEVEYPGLRMVHVDDLPLMD